MPTIFRKDGCQFFFYGNEHHPIHVHVPYEGGEAIFTIKGDITLRESHGLKVRELLKAQKLAEENKDAIIRQWHECFK